MFKAFAHTSPIGECLRQLSRHAMKRHQIRQAAACVRYLLLNISRNAASTPTPIRIVSPASGDVVLAAMYGDEWTSAINAGRHGGSGRELSLFQRLRTFRRARSHGHADLVDCHDA